MSEHQPVSDQEVVRAFCELAKERFAAGDYLAAWTAAEMADEYTAETP